LNKISKLASASRKSRVGELAGVHLRRNSSRRVGLLQMNGPGECSGIPPIRQKKGEWMGHWSVLGEPARRWSTLPSLNKETEEYPSGAFFFKVVHPACTRPCCLLWFGWWFIFLQEVLLRVSLPGRIEFQLLSKGEAVPFLFGWLGWPGAVRHFEQQFGAGEIACQSFLRKHDGDLLWVCPRRPPCLQCVVRAHRFRLLLRPAVLSLAGLSACFDFL